jgi:hypothetical protein
MFKFANFMSQFKNTNFLTLPKQWLLTHSQSTSTNNDDKKNINFNNNNNKAIISGHQYNQKKESSERMFDNIATYTAARHINNRPGIIIGGR